MNKKSMTWIVMLVLSLLAAFLMAACGSSGGTDMASFSVTVTNVSSNQPLSPVAVVLHSGTYGPWEIGAAVTHGLEVLAEGGDPSEFISEANAHTDVMATAAGMGAVGPGGSDTVVVKAPEKTGLRISVATMLVNTNDGFTGVNGSQVGALSAGDSMTIYANVYDAGTESNDESMGTVPGPATSGSGEGYNSARNDRDFAAGHSGVVTADDGLAGSALDGSHRFVGPVAKVTVTRTD